KIINTKFSVKFNTEEKQIKELAQKNAEENLNKYNLLYSAKLVKGHLDSFILTHNVVQTG
ncbi:MAG: hypothetical protein Q8830_02720, partial [Candidatus Phytoplasma australasiaticum]|nr:hypothetical protein [Candidatus Phytoplasma australasiaticum]